VRARSIERLPEARRATDPFQLAELLRGSGIAATATGVPMADNALVELKVPGRDVHMMLIRRSLCKVFEDPGR
jgi:hypothetical protein